MNDKLNVLFNQYYVDKTKNFKQLISDLDSEIDSLMNTDPSNYDDFSKITQLISDYGIQLNNQGYVKKAKVYIDKGIYNISIDEKLKDTDLFKDELYEYLIWTRGYINYTLKNYRLASKDFKALVLRFPENDRYKNWYHGSINYWPNQILWGFLAVIIINVIIGYKSKYFLYVDLIGLVGLVGTWSYKQIKRIK